MRADALAVELVGNLGEPVIDEASDDLPILQDEGNVEAPHLEHGLGAGRLAFGIAEARIEEAGIVHAVLPDQRIERRHLRYIGRRHRYALLRGKDVELMRIEHEALVLREMDPLPVLIHVVDADLIDVDHTGITARAVADEP